MKLILVINIFLFSIISQAHAEKVEGGINPSEIRKVFNENMPKFKHCYQAELDKAKESFDFNSRVKFKIDSKGKTSNFSTESTQHSESFAKVQRCIGLVIQELEFPKPVGGGSVEVVQPMNFYANKK